MTELGADGMNANGQISTKYMMRGMSLLTVFIAAKMSSVIFESCIDNQGLCLYWIVNACFATIQTLCINPAARATLKRWVTFNKKVENVIPPPPELTPTMKKKIESMNQVDVDKLVNDVKDSVFNDKK